MLRVGLTGGIGSGKSTVARRLSSRGAVVVDADQLAREVVAPGTPGFAAVVARFGADVVTDQGTLDRARLAAQVFSDPQALAALEAITHPLIAVEAGQRLDAISADRVAVYDMPLLVEKRLWPDFHLCLVVSAPIVMRLDRLVRRGLDRADAERRLAAQATDAERRAAADIWLDNAGDESALEATVDQVWRARIAVFNHNLSVGIPAHPVDQARATIGDRLAARLSHHLAPWHPVLVAASRPGEICVLIDPATNDPDLSGCLGRCGLVPVSGQDWYASADPVSGVRVQIRTRAVVGS